MCYNNVQAAMSFSFADTILASLGCLAGTKLRSIQTDFHRTATIPALITQTDSLRPGRSPGGSKNVVLGL